MEPQLRDAAVGVRGDPVPLIERRLTQPVGAIDPVRPVGCMVERDERLPVGGSSGYGLCGRCRGPLWRWGQPGGRGLSWRRRPGGRRSRSGCRGRCGRRGRRCGRSGRWRGCSGSCGRRGPGGYGCRRGRGSWRGRDRRSHGWVRPGGWRGRLGWSRRPLGRGSRRERDRRSHGWVGRVGGRHGWGCRRRWVRCLGRVGRGVARGCHENDGEQEHQRGGTDGHGQGLMRRQSRGVGDIPNTSIPASIAHAATPGNHRHGGDAAPTCRMAPWVDAQGARGLPRTIRGSCNIRGAVREPPLPKH